MENTKKKVLIAGATGLLGGRLIEQFGGEEFKPITHGMTKAADLNVDLTRTADAIAMLDRIRPDLIINLVCLSNVDRCETEPDLAYRLNVRALENLARWKDKNRKTRLVQISTDHVYDGEGEHDEDDVTIRNGYAMSKLAADFVALSAGGLVLRTNFFGLGKTEGKSSFSDWVIKSLRSGDKITLFTDVMFTPLSMRTLSGFIKLAALTDVAGIFNLGSRNGMSKRDFAHRIAERFGLSINNAVDGKLSDLDLKAARPTGMMMNCEKFEKTFGVVLPKLADEINQTELTDDKN